MDGGFLSNCTNSHSHLSGEERRERQTVREVRRTTEFLGACGSQLGSIIGVAKNKQKTILLKGLLFLGYCI